MSQRRSLLRQHIHRAIYPGRKPLLVAVSLCISQPLLLQAAERQTEWSCRPAGESWSCSKHQLTPAEQEQAAADCCQGVYRAPPREDQEAGSSPETSPARITADISEWKQETTTVMTGDVRLKKGFRQLRADRASINQVTSNVTLEGDIQLREPGLLLTGDRADLNMDSGAAQIENASYLLHKAGIRGDARIIARGGDRTMIMRDANLTRCEPGDDTWLLKGSEIRIDPDTDQGTAKHMRIELRGVPIVYLPYLRFPTSDARQSGFLFPSISSSDDGGIDYTQPYYFNLAPNYDLTLSPRYMSDRGAMIEAEARHLSTQFDTRVSAAWLGDDNGGDDPDLQDLVDDGVITEAEAFPYQGQDRWLLNVEQTGGMAARWYSSIDFTSISDLDYFRHMDTPSLEVNSNTHLRKSGVLGYSSEHWRSQIKAEEFESITSRATTPYKQLPRINLDGRYVYGGDLILSLDNEYVRFDHRDVDNDMLLTGDRVRLEYDLTWNKEWIWGFFKPSIGGRGLAYQFDDEYLQPDANDTPSFGAGQGSVDMGLYFEREDKLFGEDYLQTFEPRLFYLYREHDNQDELIRIGSNNQSVDFDTTELTFSYSQLFRDQRFTGGDRIDDANRLSVGLTTRFLDIHNGSELFSASIGQIFYFEDRAIDLLRTSDEFLASGEGQAQHSEYAAQLSAEVGGNWRWRADIAWDPDDSDRTSRGSTSLRYSDDNYGLFNLAYRYVRKDTIIDSQDLDNDGDSGDLLEQTIEQGDISFMLPFWGNWSVIARHNYDFTHNRELESLFGVEYNNCCYLTRLVARRWLDNDLIDVVASLDLEEDEGIFFEFYFKSLGGLGSKVGGILADSIFGYQERN